LVIGISENMAILVTGGGGFLGQAVVRQLIQRGERVSILNRGRYSELEELGVVCHRGDIADFEIVRAACQGADAVIHVAAKADPGLYWPDFERANVLGTDNVIKACRELGIRVYKVGMTWPLEPAGIYLGTNSGALFASRDEGDSWSLIAQYLPMITSVETLVVDA
jgi:NAD(P)-dependent dehydrogenase (short-subunit alcohol dehydrogenase family)